MDWQYSGESKMKAYVKVMILILIFLAVLIPFASEYPDGLETVVGNLGIGESKPIWKGLMPDYTFPSIDNAYVSTLLAGILGVLLVSGAAFLLGMAKTKPKVP